MHLLTVQCLPSPDIVQEFFGFKKLLAATGEIHVAPKPKVKDNMEKFLLVSHAETHRGELQTYDTEFWWLKIGNCYP
jgi:hypothetical protein